MNSDRGDGYSSVGILLVLFFLLATHDVVDGGERSLGTRDLLLRGRLAKVLQMQRMKKSNYIIQGLLISSDLAVANRLLHWIMKPNSQDLLVHCTSSLHIVSQNNRDGLGYTPHLVTSPLMLHYFCLASLSFFLRYITCRLVSPKLCFCASKC